MYKLLLIVILFLAGCHTETLDTNILNKPVKVGVGKELGSSSVVMENDTHVYVLINSHLIRKANIDTKDKMWFVIKFEKNPENIYMLEDGLMLDE